MSIITTYELKRKPRIIISVVAILCQLLALFGSNLGLPDMVKGIAFGVSIIGYCFFCLPKIDVWQEVDKENSK